MKKKVLVPLVVIAAILAGCNFSSAEVVQDADDSNLSAGPAEEGISSAGAADEGLPEDGPDAAQDLGTIWSSSLMIEDPPLDCKGDEEWFEFTICAVDIKSVQIYTSPPADFGSSVEFVDLSEIKNHEVEVCWAFDADPGIGTGYAEDPLAVGAELIVCAEGRDGSAVSRLYGETGELVQELSLSPDTYEISLEQETGIVDLNPLVFEFQVTPEMTLDSFELGSGALVTIATRQLGERALSDMVLFTLDAPEGLITEVEPNDYLGAPTSLSTLTEARQKDPALDEFLGDRDIHDAATVIDFGTDCTPMDPADDELFACPAAIDSVDVLLLDAGVYLLALTFEDPSSSGQTEVCGAFDFASGGYNNDKAAEGTDVFVCTELGGGTAYAEEYGEFGAFIRDAFLGPDLAYVSKNAETGAVNLEPLIYVFEVPPELDLDATLLDGSAFSVIAYFFGNPPGVDVLEVGTIFIEADTGDYSLELTVGE